MNLVGREEVERDREGRGIKGSFRGQVVVMRKEVYQDGRYNAMGGKEWDGMGCDRGA